MLKRTLLIMVGVGLLAVPAFAQDVILSSIADAYLDDHPNNENTNWGTGTDLIIGGTPPPQHITGLVEFDVSSLTNDVILAELFMYNDDWMKEHGFLDE